MMVNAILELRSKLDNGTIKRRQYLREVDNLLANVSQEKLDCFDELEQSLDDGEIDLAEYKVRLAELNLAGENAEGEDVQASRLPIFISYGHKSHEETVHKVKEALEARGHKIWIDTQGITEGTDWRRKIYDGIRSSQLFLAFVSQKSIESEYCQTEIRIAVGAPQTLLPVCPLMLENVGIPQSINHIQTVNFIFDEKDPTAFDNRLKSLTEWIDRDEHFAFCQEMENLREKFGNPESFEARLRFLMSQPFVGRKWLVEKISEWDRDDSSRLFGIIGGPGFGKSIFVANLRSLVPEKVAATQFIEWDKSSKYTPKQIIKNLAFQLAARITQYRELLINAVKDIDLDGLDESSLFTKLLSEPLCFENPNNTYWVILDALDEATGQDGRNTFVQTLMRNMDQLPKWLKFIVTSRPDAAVITYLKNRGMHLFDADKQIQQWQHDDMMEYLHEVLKEFQFSDAVLEDIIVKSQGMFLYLHFICQDIRQNNLSVTDIRQLPSGIDAIYQNYFDRQFSGDRYHAFTDDLRPILRLYCAAMGPLPLDFLAEALNKGVDSIRSAIDWLGTLKTYSSKNGREYFSLVHKSIWDWLARQPEDSSIQSFRVVPEEGLHDLKAFCLKKIADYQFERLSKDVNCEYPLEFIVDHLIATNDLEGICKLFCEEKPRLLEIQKDYFGNYAVALNSCKKALLYFEKCYCDSGRQQLLPHICRLLATFSDLRSKGAPSLQEILHEGNTQEKALDIMKEIKSAKLYFLIGCYLLTQAKNRSWDIDALIRAMEKKCTGHLISTWDLESPRGIVPARFDEEVFCANQDMVTYLPKREKDAYCEFINSRVLPIYEDAISYMCQQEEDMSSGTSTLSVNDLLFLGYGPLASALPILSEQQLERLVRIIPAKNEREFLLDTISAGLTAPKINNTLLHVEKLRHYAGFQFSEPEYPEDVPDSLSDIIWQDFYDRLLCFDKKFDNSTAEQLIAETSKSDTIFDGLTNPTAILLLADQEHRLGHTQKAIDILRKKQDLCADGSLRFSAEFCRLGDIQRGYNLFEMILQDQEKKNASQLKAYPAAGIRLGTLAIAEKWDDIEALVQQSPQVFQDMPLTELASFLTQLMPVKQYGLVSELLHLRTLDIPSLCEVPELFGIIHQLQETGEWNDDVPGIPELRQWIRHKHMRIMATPGIHWLLGKVGAETYYSDFSKLILKPGAPQELQLEFIKCAYHDFRAITDDKNTAADDLLRSFKIMIGLLSQNSAELKEKLYPYVNDLLGYFNKLDSNSIADLGFFAPDSENRENPFRNMLLHDTLPQKHLDKCVKNMPAYVGDRLYSYVFYGLYDEAKELLSHNYDLGDSCLKQIISYHADKKLRDEDYDWKIPQGFVNLVEEWTRGQFSTIGMAKMLYLFRDQENARKIGLLLYRYEKQKWEAIPAPSALKYPPLAHLTWAVGWKKLRDDIGEDSPGTEADSIYLEQLILSGEIDIADVQKYSLRFRYWAKHEPELLPRNWFEAATETFSRCKLLRLTLQKGTREQTSRVLDEIDVNMLVDDLNKSYEYNHYPRLDLVKLYHALHDAEWSDEDIHSVMCTQNWSTLSYKELCEIAPCMAHDRKFIQLWFKSTLSTINGFGSPQICRNCISGCPELFTPEAFMQRQN